jgi:ferredoxin-NADP reductase
VTTGPTTSDALRRHAHHSLRVVEVVDETAETKTYVVAVPEDLADDFTYDAGQFCTVRVRIDGDEVSRCYSMSSAPARGEPLAVTVKRVAGGLVSNWLHDHVRVGDELELMPPAGVFCTRRDDVPLLALCGGSGVTPVFSIVKQVLATTDRTVRVFDANRDRASIIFAGKLDRMAASYGGRLAVHHHIDSETGHPTAADITRFVGTAVDGEVFVCGPTPFMDLVEAAAVSAGVPAGSIAIERFVNPTDDEDAGTAAPGPTAPGPTAADQTTAMTITIKRKRHAVAYVAGDTILEAARRAGLKPPSSCEQGNCATCMALLTSGGATMRANNALTDDEVAEGWVLTCQALPVGAEVAVEYDDF